MHLGEIFGKKELSPKTRRAVERLSRRIRRLVARENFDKAILLAQAAIEVLQNELAEDRLVADNKRLAVGTLVCLDAKA